MTKAKSKFHQMFDEACFFYDGELAICRECNTKKVTAYRNTKEGRKKVYATVKRYEAKNKRKRSAWMKVNAALKKGSLLRPNKCSVCTILCKPDAHHEDYSKPLDVVWVCRFCHKRLDKRVRDRLVNQTN